MRPPTALLALEDAAAGQGEGEAGSYRLAQCAVHSSGVLLLEMKDGELYDALLRRKGYNRTAGLLSKGTAAAAGALGAAVGGVAEGGNWLDGDAGLGLGVEDAYGDGYADDDGGGCDDYCGADGDDGGGIDLDDGLLPAGGGVGVEEEAGPPPDWLRLGGEGGEGPEPMDAELPGGAEGDAAAPAAAAAEEIGVEGVGLVAAGEELGDAGAEAVAAEGGDEGEGAGGRGRRGAGQRGRKGEQVANMDQGYYDPYQPLDPSDKGNLPIKPLQVITKQGPEHLGVRLPS